ncbi:alpha/beta fold hydrolase [Pseudonocardia alaniniphila]|uniref:Alpha/beta hydrolase n=1 Tax=Pseudonocardia alaniniphila TaxID=75291 RepID=A0ABS9TM80_9PSEU|nr:alpha/beta hydrolase [Pseudonocardia alaniniphila]MCH6169498.1 alpha/beta hydrolase [Pseudonocardia alaniniphila]
MGSTVIVNDGQHLHHTDHGGSGPVVVLLHSFLMDERMFASQIAALRSDFRLVTVDERGHGGTPADAPFDYWDVARDVLALLDHLGIDSAAVAGTSQGGFVALRMALLAPDRVTALAVMGSSGAAEDPQVAAAYRQLAESWAANGPKEEQLDAVAGTCLGSMPADGWKETWRSVPGDRLLRIMSTLVERDGVLGRLDRIRCPALVLHGSADAAYPVARAEELAAGIPGAEQLVVVEDGAHFLSLTHAEAVNPHLQRFLAAHA